MTRGQAERDKKQAEREMEEDGDQAAEGNRIRPPGESQGEGQDQPEDPEEGSTEMDILEHQQVEGGRQSKPKHICPHTRNNCHWQRQRD